MRKREALVLLLCTLILASIIFFEPLRFLDNLFYDLNFAFSPKKAGDSVVVVVFDSKSLSTIGGWPWNRSKIAEVIDKINALNPRVIALDILLPIRDAKDHNDNLAFALSRVKNCIVPFRAIGFSANKPSQPLSIPPIIYKHRFLRLKNQNNLKDISFYQVTDFDPPDTLFSRYSRYSGFLNISTSNTSQKLREIIHVVCAGNEYFPSFGLSAVAAYYQLKPEEFILDGDAKIWLDKKSVPISTHAASALLNFRSQEKPIVTISALDVLNGSAPRELLEDKLVFVGVDDPAAGADFFTTPVTSQYPGVKVWATAALDIFENASVINGGGIFGFVNWLLTLILFPGLAIAFAVTRKRIGVLLGIGLLFLSFLISYILFQQMNYFWNPSHQLFAWLFSLVWTATKKTQISTKLIESLKLELAEETSAENLDPPADNFILAKVPQTATAHHVLNTIIPDVMTVILKPGEIAPVQGKQDAEPAEPSKQKIDSGSKEADNAIKMSEEDFIKFQNLCNGKIVKLLGSGGMADVYLVWIPRMEVYRAVKVLKPDQPASFLNRFETEIRIFAKLDHPNIVHCYGVGEWHSLPYFEMEYIHGASLEEIIRSSGPVSAEQAAIVGLLICRALDYAHNLKMTLYGKTYDGVVHRDLKPANVLISRSGKVKLTDFGIARPASVSLHTMDTSNFVGTLPYLSPEQLDGHDIDAQSDIYALGVTIYEMLTGKRAFPQKDVTSLMRAKSLGQFAVPLTSSSLVPKQLVDIFDTAVKTDKQLRYHSAREMMIELEKFIRDRLEEPGYLHLQRLVKKVWT